MKRPIAVTLIVSACLALRVGGGRADASPRALRLDPARIELPLGGTRQFRAHGAPSRGPAVRWRVVNGIGAVTDEGFYSAPARAVPPRPAVPRAGCEGAGAGEARSMHASARHGVRVRAQ